MRKIAGFSLLLFIFSACVLEKTKHGLHLYAKSNRFDTPNGYIVAKPVKFKLQKTFAAFDTNILSTSSLYTHQCSDSNWFKFYPDGKFLYGNNTGFPKSDYDVPQAQAGFYNVNGTKFKIELTYIQKGNRWSNLLLEGEIVGDTLKIYRDHYGKNDPNIHHFTGTSRDPYKACRYYIKSKRPFYLREPDW